MKKMNRKQLTLIELIIVIVVLGILVGLAAPKFTGVVRDAKHAQFLNDVDVLSSVAMMVEAQREQDEAVFGHDAAGTELVVTAGSDLELALIASGYADAAAIAAANIMPLNETVFADNMGKPVSKGDITDYYVVTAGGNAGTIVYGAAEGVMDGKDVEYFGLNIKK